MALPKIKYSTHKTKLPSGLQVEFRPMTNAEQKVLMTAKESDDPKDALLAAAEVVAACFNLNRKNVAMIDVEYAFACLRARSVGTTIDTEYKNPEDGKIYKAVIDLEGVSIELPEGHEQKVFEIADGIHIEMQDALIEDVIKSTGATPNQWDLMVASIKSVTDGDDVTLAKDVTKDELREWIMKLPMEATLKFSQFFNSRPKVIVPMKFTNSASKPEVVNVTGFRNFFA